MKYLKADLAFSSRTVRIVNIIMIAAFTGISLLVIKVPTLAVSLFFICGTFIILMEFILDYFKYFGIGNRKQHIMNMVRSSGKGVQTIKNALIGDLIFSFLKTVVIIGGSSVPTLLYGNPIEQLLGKPLLLIAVSAILLAYTLQSLCKWLTRSLSMSLQTYTFVGMLIAWIASILYVVPLVLMMAVLEDSASIILVAVITSSASILLGALLSVLTVRKSLSGFTAGYRDTVVSA